MSYAFNYFSAAPVTTTCVVFNKAATQLSPEAGHDSALVTPAEDPTVKSKTERIEGQKQCHGKLIKVSKFLSWPRKTPVVV